MFRWTGNIWTRHFNLPIALHLFVQFISQRDTTLGEKSKEQKSGWLQDGGQSILRNNFESWKSQLKKQNKTPNWNVPLMNSIKESPFLFPWIPHKQFLPHKYLSEALYIHGWILRCSTNILDQNCLPRNDCCNSNNMALERASLLEYKLSHIAAASNGVLQKGIAWKTGDF